MQGRRGSANNEIDVCAIIFEEHLYELCKKVLIDGL
jgi:hypothetical protein